MHPETYKQLLKLERNLEFKEWQDKMQSYLETGVGFQKCSEEGPVSPIVHNARELMKNVHNVMELAVETNIKLTNAINNINIVHNKFVEDSIKFQDIMKIKFSNLQNIVNKALKKLNKRKNKTKLNKRKHGPRARSPSSSSSSSSTSSSSSSTKHRSPKSKLPQRCIDCSEFKIHNVDDCPYKSRSTKKTNYKKDKDRKNPSPVFYKSPNETTRSKGFFKGSIKSQYYWQKH